MGRKSIIEDAIGVLDGANDTFNTSATYVVGTVRAFRNGQLTQKVCVVELGGTTFRINEILESWEFLQVHYTTVV